MRVGIHVLLLVVLFTSCKSGFLSGNKTKVGKEIVTESGLKVMWLEKGEGEKAEKGDIVEVHYTGKLENDTVFDSSIPRGKPIKFELGAGQVIPGWDEGIQMLSIGDKAKFTIPPELGYAEKAVGSIPANSTLFFEVELISLKKPPKPYPVEGKDTVELPSGLKYIMVESNPEGEKAISGKNVRVHYSGYLLDGSMFDSSVKRGQPFEFPLGQGRVIKGWDEGVALMRAGEKARFIIPYQLAYGEKGYPPVIPASSTLVFDVEFIENLD